MTLSSKFNWNYGYLDYSAPQKAQKSDTKKPTAAKSGPASGCSQAPPSGVPESQGSDLAQKFNFKASVEAGFKGFKYTFKKSGSNDADLYALANTILGHRAKASAAGNAMSSVEASRRLTQLALKDSRAQDMLDQVTAQAKTDKNNAALVHLEFAKLPQAKKKTFWTERNDHKANLPGDFNELSARILRYDNDSSRAACAELMEMARDLSNMDRAIAAAALYDNLIAYAKTAHRGWVVKNLRRAYAANPKPVPSTTSTSASGSPATGKTKVTVNKEISDARPYVARKKLSWSEKSRLKSGKLTEADGYGKWIELANQVLGSDRQTARQAAAKLARMAVDSINSSRAKQAEAIIGRLKSEASTAGNKKAVQHLEFAEKHLQSDSKETKKSAYFLEEEVNSQRWKLLGNKMGRAVGTVAAIAGVGLCVAGGIALTMATGGGFLGVVGLVGAAAAAIGIPVPFLVGLGVGISAAGTAIRSKFSKRVNSARNRLHLTQAALADAQVRDNERASKNRSGKKAGRPNSKKTGGVEGAPKNRSKPVKNDGKKTYKQFAAETDMTKPSDPKQNLPRPDHISSGSDIYDEVSVEADSDGN